MSMFTAASDPGIREAGRPATSALDERPLPVILLGVALAFALSWPRLVEIWTANTFFDTDDAMRLVQVRDWLGGQGWYDLVEHRLFPPGGLLMHWSRVVDVPVGGLIRIFGLLAGPDRAERLARIAFPLLLQGGLVAAAVLTARMLLGWRAMLPATVMVVLTAFMFEQFPAGRIDHHAPQIMLLLTMAGTLLSALAPGRGRDAAWTGLCLALSLAISLENLPFIAVIVALAPVAWLIDPARGRPALLWFAASLTVCVPVLFVATVPPARYLAVTPDAFSLPHVLGALAGAAGFVALALASDRLPLARQRLAALALAGGGVGGLLLAAFPACLHDPYAGIDPVLKDLWLSRVTEAQPLLTASRLRPDTFTMLACPLILGAVAAAVATWRTRGLDRFRWGAILVLTLVGLVGTCWEIRVAASTQPLAMLGGLWAVVSLVEAGRRRSRAALTALGWLIVVPFTTFGWALVPSGRADEAAAAALAAGQRCRTAEALAPLAALPPGLVFAPIDDGSHLLVATPHAVVAAPYHRNQRGNRLVLDGFLASPADAEALVRGSGARYVALCVGEVQIDALTRRAPQGLGARLAAGDTPPWLAPVPLAGTPYRLWAVR